MNNEAIAATFIYVGRVHILLRDLRNNPPLVLRLRQYHRVNTVLPRRC